MRFYQVFGVKTGPMGLKAKKYYFSNGISMNFVLPGRSQMLPGHTESFSGHTELFPRHTDLFAGHTELFHRHTMLIKANLVGA